MGHLDSIKHASSTRTCLTLHIPFLHRTLVGLLSLTVGCGEVENGDSEQKRRDEQAEGCANWQPEGAWSSLPTSRPAALVQLTPARDGNSLYVVGGWLEAGVPRTDLFRSADGGTTWCVIATPEQPSQVIVSPADSRVLYALSAEHTRHLSKTTDGGASWTVMPELPEEIAYAEFAASTTDVNTLWINSSEHTLISTDGAEHWRTLEPPGELTDPSEGAYVTRITIDPTSDEKLFAVGWRLNSENGYSGRAFASTDGGETWQESFPPLESSVYVPNAFASSSGALRVQADEAISASEDWGQTWRALEPLPPEAGLVHLGVDETEALFAWESLGPHFWISASTETEWQEIPLPDPDFVPLLATRASIVGMVDVGMVTEGLATTDDVGESWSLLDPVPTLSWLLQSPVAPFPIWASSPAASSHDGGLTWNAAPFDGQPVFDGRSADTVFLNTYQALERTEDGGRTWDTVELPDAVAEIHAVVTCPPPDSCLYVMYRRASDDTAYPTRIARSNDRGHEWAEPVPLPDGYFYNPDAIAVLPDSTDHLMASGGDALEESRDGGRTWTSLEVPGVNNVGSIAVLPDSTLLVASSHLGIPEDLVVRSTDNGETWNEVPEGIGRLVVSRAQPDTVFILGISLLRSDDRGQTWVSVSPDAWSEGFTRVLGVADAPDGGFVATVETYGLVGFE